MAESRAAALHAAVRGGDAGSLARGGTGLAAGASRATRGSAAAAGGVAAAAAHVRTAQLQDSALCWPDWGEEVVGGSTVGCAAYKCSTASAGTTHPVPVELFGEEEEEDGPFARKGMVGLQKVDQSLELRDERAGATGGRFGMPQAALIQLSYHSCIALKRGSTIKTGIEGVSLHAAICPDRDQPKPPLFVDPVLRGPESYTAPSRARQASAAAAADVPTTPEKAGIKCRGRRALLEIVPNSVERELGQGS